MMVYVIIALIGVIIAASFPVDILVEIIFGLFSIPPLLFAIIVWRPLVVGGVVAVFGPLFVLLNYFKAFYWILNDGSVRVFGFSALFGVVVGIPVLLMYSFSILFRRLVGFTDSKVGWWFAAASRRVMF